MEKSPDRQSKKRGRQEVLSVFGQVAAALEYVHKNGVLHGDIKPENILIDTAGVAKIADFGLAKLDGESVPSESSPSHEKQTLEATLSRAGTPAYMAPEQLRGLRASAASDQYSFCVCLYEALFGKRPFPSTSVDEIISLQGQVVEFGRCSRRLRALLRQGLAADPEQRFASMHHLAVALNQGQKRGKALYFAGALLVLVTIIFALQRSRGSNAVSPCGDGAAIVDVAWSKRDKTMLRSEAGRRAATALEEFAHAWRAERQGTCEATHLLHEQSEASLDLRVECLDDRLRDFSAMVDEVVRLEEQNQGQDLFNGMVASLTPIQSCRNAAVLARYKKLKVPIARRSEYEALDADNARIFALVSSQQFEKAEKLAAQIVDNASSVGLENALAEALYLRGVSLSRLGHPEAEVLLQDAIEMSDRVGDDLIRAYAWGEQYSYLSRHGKLDRAEAVYGQAEASVLRIADEGALSNLVDGRGVNLQKQGKFRDALKVHIEALALRKSAFGEETGPVASVLINIGQLRRRLGDTKGAVVALEAAMKIYQNTSDDTRQGGVLVDLAAAYGDSREFGKAAMVAAKALSLQEREFGKDGMQLVTSLLNLGLSLVMDNRADEAVPHLVRAKAMVDKLPEMHRNHPYALSYLGAAEASLRRAEVAIPLLEEGLKLYLATSGDAMEIASCRFWLAKALEQKGGAQKRVKSLATLALDSYREHGRSYEHAEIEAWLKANDPP